MDGVRTTGTAIGTAATFHTTRTFTSRTATTIAGGAIRAATGIRTTATGITITGTKTTTGITQIVTSLKTLGIRTRIGARRGTIGTGMRAPSIAAIAATAIPAAGDVRTLSADIVLAAMRGQIAIAGVQALAAKAAGEVAAVGLVGVAGAAEAADAG